jgi:hypothetical protein
MFKITVEGMLDDGTPVSEFSLCFESELHMDEVIRNITEVVDEMLPPPLHRFEYERREVNEQVHHTA